MSYNNENQQGQQQKYVLHQFQDQRNKPLEHANHHKSA